MAIDRAALTSYLATEYDTLLADAGIALTDTPDGLAPVLDNVVVAVDRDDALDAVWHEPLARYYALQRIVRRLARRMDITTGGDAFRLNQKFTNAVTLFKLERPAVSWLVDLVPPSDLGGTFVMESQFLTPSLDAWRYDQ